MLVFVVTKSLRTTIMNEDDSLLKETQLNRDECPHTNNGYPQQTGGSFDKEMTFWGWAETETPNHILCWECDL